MSSELYYAKDDGTYGKITTATIDDLSVTSDFEDTTKSIIFDTGYSDTLSLESIPCTFSFLDSYHLINGCCCNCGAPVKGDYCEYCGTNYKREFKTELVIRKEKE